jgi:CheY-like chemotaxis protein
LTLGQLGATIRYHDLSEGTFELGAVRATTRYLNHPGISLGYRLEADGATFVYATDHEPHSPYPRLGDSADDEVHREDRRHIEFLAGAQLVIHDSQYTLEEYRQKMTWGHSPVERVVDFALAARVERLALFHHDPLRTDDAVDWLVDLARARVADAGSSLDVFAAFEGQVIELAARAPAAHGLPPAPAALAPAHLEGPATILMVDDDPEIINLLSLTLQGDGFRLLAASDGDTALAMSRAEHPDLVLLDWSMPGRNGLEVCRALRADPELKLREVPVVMLTVQAEREHTAAGFAAGASDYLVKPFKLTHVRARVHAWLLRSRRARSAGV